jgi:hypothetical protein
MAIEQAPFTIDIDWLVREIQQLGLNRTDPPGLHERRMKIENERYKLYVWNGSEDVLINEYTAADILTMLKTVDGSGSGLDADKLDGEHGNDFHDATKITGTIPRARFGALWRDVDTNEESSPFIQSGQVTILAGTGTQSVNFDYAYTSVPRVTTSTNWPNAAKWVSTSTSGFIIQQANYDVIVNWSAIGRRN